MKGTTYDCILSINATHTGEGYPAKLQTLKNLMSERGYICLCEIIPNEQIHAFEGLLHHEGLLVSKSENITKNVLQAIKLEARNLAAEPFSLQSTHHETQN